MGSLCFSNTFSILILFFLCHSGRGTPNVSGRDTPSSQIEEEQSRPLDLPVTAQKQNREDIDDRFGKFEIKQLAGGSFVRFCLWIAWTSVRTYGCWLADVLFWRDVIYRWRNCVNGERYMEHRRAGKRLGECWAGWSTICCLSSCSHLRLGGMMVFMSQLNKLLWGWIISWLAVTISLNWSANEE